MDLYALDYKALDLRDKSFAGMRPDEYLPEIDAVIGHMLAIGTPEAQQLAYRTRLDAMFPRIYHDAAGALQEFKSLWAMRKADPETYRAHNYAVDGSNTPTADDGTELTNLFRYFLPDIVTRLPLQEGATVDMSEEAISLAPEVFNDMGALRELQIHNYQMRNESAKVVPLLADYIPTLDDLESGALRVEEWMSRLDVAAMAYLEQGMLDECNEMIDLMVSSGRVTANQPAAMLAESLAPLAHHIPLEVTVWRARLVLTTAIADPTQVDAILQAAHFLLLGGLHSEAFALVTQTEPFIQEPVKCVEPLYYFFRDAAEAGFSGRPMMRYTSPRWQREVGVGADPSVGTLAEGFGRIAREQAYSRDARNGNRHMAQLLETRYTVPALDLEDFYGTAAHVIEDQSAHTLRFEPVDATYDDELLSYATEILDGSRQAGHYPAFAREDERMEKIFAREPSENAEVLELFRDLIAVAEDPDTDPRVRATIEFHMLSHADFPLEFVGEVGMRALPMAAAINPDAAAQHAVVILSRLEELGYSISPLSHDVLEFTTALAASADITYVTARNLVTAALGADRSMDAIALIDATLRIQGINPDVIDDPEAAEAMLKPIKGGRLAGLGAAFNGAQEILDAALTAKRRGNHSDYLTGFANALNVLITGGMYSNAEYLFGDVLAMCEDEESFNSVEPWQQVMASVAVARFIVAVRDERFSELWPAARDRFERVTDVVMREDEDAPELAPQIQAWITDLAEGLTHRGYHEESLALTSWAIQAVGQAGNPIVTELTRGSNAIALGNAGQHQEAALVFESMWERSRNEGMPAMMDWVAGHLHQFADARWSPEYAAVLARIKR